MTERGPEMVGGPCNHEFDDGMRIGFGQERPELMDTRERRACEEPEAGPPGSSRRLQCDARRGQERFRLSDIILGSHAGPEGAGSTPLLQ